MKTLQAILALLFTTLVAPPTLAAEPPPGGTPALPLIPPTAPTTGAGARLDAPLADKIAAAVTAHTYTLTESSEEPGGGQDIPNGGALLVGLEILNDHSKGVADVRSIRPYF